MVHLSSRTFAPSKHGQHDQINKEGLCLLGISGFGHDPFDDQDFSVRPHGPATVLQDGQTLLVRPVVQDIFEEIDICPDGNVFKETSWKEEDALLEFWREMLLCLLNHSRGIKKDAMSPRVTGQNTGEQPSVSPSNVS